MTAVSFRVRRIYYDQIVAGTKDTDFRRASEYWLKVQARVRAALYRHEKVTAVFVCGRLVHRRRLTGTIRYPSGVLAVGRDVSEQGMKDLGDGDVVGFFLREEVAS